MPENVVARHSPAPWLPPGGYAEVVLAAGEDAPEPTVVVRLLVVAGDAILVVPRVDGRGPDLPSAEVGTDTVEAALGALVAGTLREPPPVELLGFVRNTVSAPTPDYPWPAPVAHFAVWYAAAAVGSELGGTWLDPQEATDRLSARHWWPLRGPATNR